MLQTQSGEPDDLITALLDDMVTDFKGLEDGSPHDRRAFIRSAFAAVEGHLAVLRDDLLAKAGDGLTITERMALLEETFRVKDSGKVEPAAAHISLKTRVKLVARIVSRLHPEYAIDFQSNGWQALSTGLDVRDRITHPKTKQDINVEQSEAQTTLAGVSWFLIVVITPGHEGIAAYLEKRSQGLALADLSQGYARVRPSVPSPPED